MIVVDSSVLVCLLREEPETPHFMSMLWSNAGSLTISAANYLEAGIVVDAQGKEALSERLDRLIAHFRIEIVSVTPHHARVARQAYQTYGKGYHPAKLNYGDTFAYALAQTEAAPLLFKGNDFSQTDVRIASRL